MLAARRRVVVFPLLVWPQKSRMKFGESTRRRSGVARLPSRARRTRGYFRTSLTACRHPSHDPLAWKPSASCSFPPSAPRKKIWGPGLPATAGPADSPTRMVAAVTSVRPQRNPSWLGIQLSWWVTRSRGRSWRLTASKSARYCTRAAALFDVTVRPIPARSTIFRAFATWARSAT
jgi:hypothetical protein